MLSSLLKVLRKFHRSHRQQNAFAADPPGACAARHGTARHQGSHTLVFPYFQDAVDVGPFANPGQSGLFDGQQDESSVKISRQPSRSSRAAGGKPPRLSSKERMISASPASTVGLPLSLTLSLFSISLSFSISFSVGTFSPPSVDTLCPVVCPVSCPACNSLFAALLRILRFFAAQSVFAANHVLIIRD